MVSFKFAAPVVIGIVALFATSANALQILGFSQLGTTNTVTATANGALTITTISTTDSGSANVVVANYAGGGAPFVAFLNWTATSFTPATIVAGIIHQSYMGSFSITSATGGGGTNYLSGTFTDDLTGSNGGSQVTLGATTPPPGMVIFTSGILLPGQLMTERALSLSLSNVVAPLSVCGSTVCGFTASQSGTFSANIMQVPEPSSIILLGTGLIGLVASFRLRQRKS